MATEQQIRDIYQQELGSSTVDDTGLQYWMGRTDLSDAVMRNAIRYQHLGADAGPSTAYLTGDQQYNAFYRGAQFDESQIQSSLQANQEALQRRIVGQQAGYDQQRLRGAEGINTSFEQRQNRTGGRLSALGRKRADVDRAQLDSTTAINEQSAGLERQAASNIAAIRREDAEQRVAARDRLSQQSVGL